MARVPARAIRISGCELEVADAVVARMKEGSCREMLDGTDALQLHSIKRRSRCTAVFPGVSVLSKPTPALSKCLKLKCRITSQAGRRGFESRLPLHLFNKLPRFRLSPEALEWSATFFIVLQVTHSK